MDWKTKMVPRVVSIPPSGIRKFFDLASTMDNVISLGVGEPDFNAPDKVIQACIASLEKGETSYTGNSGILPLREEIAKLFAEHYGVEYDPKTEITVTIGVSEAIDMTLRALLNPGDEVLIPDPAYVAYPACVTLAGGTPVLVPTRQEDGFRLTAKALEQYITAKTKVLLIGFPNNPTGTVMDRESLLAIAEVAKRHDLVVISDEIYAELTYEGAHTCIASLPGMRERTVVFNGFSKAYAMTGMRIGYACAPRELTETMFKIHQYAIMCAPTTSQKGALTALRECDADVAAMKAEYDRRRLFVYDELTKMGLPCVKPQGAFYIFPDIRSTGLTDNEFAEGLLAAERVAVVPGSAFGEQGKGHVRISYASSMENLAEAMKRIARFITSKK
ncbi:MAG: aminotransferase class I/II-fold pyridoxal phosphate-dependent enzyme [Negativicoccus succinicivorans]|uniref:pyridoxal phosphate-dependent aminotransferase n=1 Tax=Negativicoccus succinicivorans TaxID=620903 RepID=UPI0026ECFE5C|nr:aminotransferase class I/II-fold pyridoxal phosphate-dependent enzyme [Negativicoccus succinicivorans]MBS6027959.1 aminotransferase class I/II-fold pyridoxal phosphate-dependent enzyme [Negativicoccus succinicivorans]